MEEQRKTADIRAYLLSVLLHGVNKDGLVWLEEQKNRIEGDTSGLKLFTAFSQASRYFKKDPNQINPAGVTEAEQIIPGLRPNAWNQLQTARMYLLLHFQATDAEHFLKVLERLLESADMHEQEAIYAALPLLPYPESLKLRAAEGLRTNITSVFDAIALNNPYPAQYLDELAWNQMVIKSFFLQRPIYQIVDADSRANSDLAKVLLDYAHERWAAGRDVMPELWRFVAPFLTEEDLDDVQKAINSGDALEKEAAVLAVSDSGLSAAQGLLEACPEIREKIKSGELYWESIGRRFFESK